MNFFKRQTIYNTTVYLGRIIVYGVPYLFYSVKRKLLGGTGEPSRVWRNSETYSYRVRDQNGNEFLLPEPYAIQHVIRSNYKLLHRK